MAVEQIAKSDEQQIDATNLNNGIDVKNLTDKEIADLANEIVSNPNNVEQVKVFPDLWNSLNDQQKSDFVSKLEWEIKDAVDELKALWIENEYSPEVTKEDEKKIAELNFVRENKERIPQSWSKLEMKAKEVAKELADDIKKEWLDRNLNQ